MSMVPYADVFNHKSARVRLTGHYAVEPVCFGEGSSTDSSDSEARHSDGEHSDGQPPEDASTPASSSGRHLLTGPLDGQ